MGTVFAVDIAAAAKDIDGFKNFGEIVTVIAKNAFVLAGVVSFILLLLGGFGVIVSAGDAKKAEQGKNMVTAAVAGLLLVVGSFWIVQIVGAIAGRNLLNPPGF